MIEFLAYILWITIILIKTWVIFFLHYQANEELQKNAREDWDTLHNAEYF